LGGGFRPDFFDGGVGHQFDKAQMGIEGKYGEVGDDGIDHVFGG
jgi:hypothetical protein